MTAANQGAFVLEVGELGKEVLSTFTKFVLSRKVHDHRLENLLATISITTSLLVELGSTINKYEEDYVVKDEITRPTCQTCKDDFEQLIAMSKIAKEKGGWITESPSGGQPIATEVDPWFVFNVTLGQGEKATKFWSRLNSTRQILDALNDTLKFKIFKQLEQENRLDAKQAEELRNLKTLVPRMVQTLEKTEKERKERLALEEKKVKAKQAPKTVKSSRRRPDVGEKDDFAEFIEKAEADASSQDTVIEADVGVGILKKKSKKQVKFADSDDDHSSISSHEAHPNENAKVIYEEWLLSYNSPRSVVRRSWGLLGLKFKEYDEETEYWDIEPELRTQGELKSAHETAMSSMSESKYQTSINKAIKALPEHARDLMDWLVEDRAEATNNERRRREWSIAAVRPREKHVYRTGKKLVKNVKGNDWLIMIKGENLGKVARTRPDRYKDPWAPPRVRKCYPGRYDRFDERDYDRPRPRPHYEEDDYITRQPVVVMEERNFGSDSDSDEEERDLFDDAFRSGMINVGMFSSQEDAEERMDKVLDDMAGKDEP